MPQYVALLRGINLGNRRVKMAALAAHFTALGFRNVATFIASGNVLFETRASDERKLVSRIEAHLAQSLGYEVDTFVRTRTEIAAVVAADPFDAATLQGPIHAIYVGFLREPLSPATATALAAIKTATDEFRVVGREYYWLCRIKSVDSTVWASPAIRALKLPTATTRNITMLRRLTAEFPVS